MKYLEKLIHTFQRKKIPLGRWNIIYCDKHLNRKIDLANEDNCGPCGEYALKKVQSVEISIPKPPIHK
jgi:hypothetical protein